LKASNFRSFSFFVIPLILAHPPRHGKTEFEFSS
jgi:hypothetical protein